MDDALKKFGFAVKSKRENLGLTQVELGEKLGMSHRTILKVENCQSNSKFETVALLAQELNISLDAVVFSNTFPTEQMPKEVSDFFVGMSPDRISAYIAILNAIKTMEEMK